MVTGSIVETTVTSPGWFSADCKGQSVPLVLKHHTYINDRGIEHWIVLLWLECTVAAL